MALNSSISYSQTTALQDTSAISVKDDSSAQASSLKLSEMRIIGLAQQQWAPLRRKYDLFLSRDIDSVASGGDARPNTSGDLPLSSQTKSQDLSSEDRSQSFVQFAFVDEPFLSWDFTLRSADDRLIGSVNRNFAGFGRELLTDTGVYALRMDSAALAAEPKHLISQTARSVQERSPAESAPGMTLDQRAVMLATAVSIDFDYFSRNRGMGGLTFLPVVLGGGGAEAGAAGAGGAAAGGAVGEVGATGVGAVGGAVRGAGIGEGAMAGAGTMAGYEAMQQGVYGNRGGQDGASPVSQDAASHEPSVGQGQSAGQEEVWGSDFDWTGSKGAGPPASGGSGGSGGEEGGGWLSDFIDGL